LEDWLELLDAVQRMVTRRRLQPDDEERVRRRIRERFPETKI
jgi:predicted ATP-dependent Lon-type protease